MISVLFEDNHLIAVNKLPGELVQGDSSGDPSLSERIKAYLKDKHSKPGNVFLGVMHRLDRPTSGVVLFARTGKALSRMNRLFRESEVEKIYWAIVKERPPKDRDTLVHYLVRNRKQNKSYAANQRVTGSKEARLTYELKTVLESYHFLEIRMHTGRHHQIRAQLAAVGCRIKGDLKYGSPRSDPGGGIHLHAREIGFLHPVSGEPIRITADPPLNPLWQTVLALEDE